MTREAVQEAMKSRATTGEAGNVFQSRMPGSSLELRSRSEMPKLEARPPSSAIARSLGLGLDETAIEAIQMW